MFVLLIVRFLIRRGIPGLSLIICKEKNQFVNGTLEEGNWFLSSPLIIDRRIGIADLTLLTKPSSET